MTDYNDYDDYDDYESEEDYDCGWDGEDMCGHIGSEYCDVFCPFRRAGVLDTPQAAPVASDDTLPIIDDEIPF